MLASGDAMDRTVFEAMILPQRSLSARGQRTLLCILGTLLALGAAVFTLLGAWPVSGFAGAELLAAILFFRWHARAARASELVLLTERELVIIRTDPNGRRHERRLPTAWLNVTLEERPGRAPLLVLTGQGRHEILAAELGEPARRDLAQALATALHRLRTPVFDNPGLDEG
jgi:uncharacterized membrane protein